MAAMDSKNNYNWANHAYANNGNMHNNQYGPRGQTSQGYGFNMGNPSFAAQAKNVVMPAPGGNFGGLPVTAAMTSGVYGGAQYGYPTNYAAPNNDQPPNMYTPHASQYMPQIGYQAYHHQQDNSPVSQQTWTPTTGTNGEVPTLITPRRDSISSNENDQPATPSYAGYPSFSHGGVAVNRSPSGMFTHGTPSPTSIIGPYGMALVKQPEQSDVTPRIKMLVTREPAIPRAIPAPSSPLKPLDRALENQRGETNVYIRGLLPETTDEQLEQWGTRFGDIKSSKSIIDLNTGLCKGFGFVKYHNYEDAENCIRGFHYLGYEVSFARESFYSKLKTFADDNNTNLYVSNLPKSMNEHELAVLFSPHKVCSSKILRDKNGHGRGVGFARFESRNACDEVIKTFNNHAITSNGEELQIQIRFADTQEQKTLKQQTQAARQFRSAEYEFATQAWRQGRLPSSGSSGYEGSTTNNEFDLYLGTAPQVPFQRQRWVQSANRQLPGRSPLGNMLFSGTNAQQPSAQVSVTSNTDQKPASPVDSGKDVKTVTAESTVVDSVSNPVDSITTSEQE